MHCHSSSEKKFWTYLSERIDAEQPHVAVDLRREDSDGVEHADLATGVLASRVPRGPLSEPIA
jgi:hypothetical protein